MRRLTTLLTASALIATGMAQAASPTTAWKEVVRPDEAQVFPKFVEIINYNQGEQARRAGSAPARGFHAKHHTALTAEFRVLPDLPDHARQGVFKEARSYPCWVRLSNGVGVVQGDRKPDVRGLAIKLMDVPGAKLLPGEESATTQDFLMTNSPTTPARDGVQFMAFAEGSLDLLKMPVILAKRLGAKEALRMLTALARNTARPIRSMAIETFWSGAAVKYGPYAVRYFVKPADASRPPLSSFGSTDYLRAEFADRLGKMDLRWDFFVQFYVDETKTPVEDTSIEWKEELAPPVKVAELIVRQRDLETQAAIQADAAGNGFAYTPWHAVEEHRPLGHLQRLRKAVYAGSARYRGRTAEPVAR
ncbi:MAG: hypothetical protein HY816_01740 [Candidatus Wallbacteria bacterium]|nr:hypothetical protein [Candidatus Wallbacteria bacterium]